jgi:hypothetical protein
VKNNGEEARAREQGYTEPYKYQEYPKHLYKDGQARDGVRPNDKCAARTGSSTRPKKTRARARTASACSASRAARKRSDEAKADKKAKKAAEGRLEGDKKK